MLSTEDSKIKKFEMTLGTDFSTTSTCVLLQKNDINDTNCTL